VADGAAAIGEIAGPGLSRMTPSPPSSPACSVYADQAKPGRTFIQTLTRLGTDPFKEAVYGA
jgi:sulfite reductase (NADPH) hemoprotein beta-component